MSLIHVTRFAGHLADKPKVLLKTDQFVCKLPLHFAFLFTILYIYLSSVSLRKGWSPISLDKTITIFLVYIWVTGII
jgi:hypothetical protein